MCYNSKAMVSINQIIYSNRRSVAVQINREGELIVRAPRYFPEEQVLRFVASQEDWIRKHQARARAVRDKYEPVRIEKGAVLPLGGRKVSILPYEGADIQYDETAATLRVPVSTTPDELRRWLCRKVHDQLMGLVRVYAVRMGIAVPPVRLSRARTRWGSCSSLGRIRFSWHLVFCHPAAVEYVVVHELCHLFSMHHDRRFWNLVESYLPDRREREDWLKRNQGVMEIL
jgi:predicted metal-dependent hydrolase